MSKKDVTQRTDIESIVARFYQIMLKDPIIGFIFTDVAKIHLESHLPIIVDFWHDSLFLQGRVGERKYTNNTLKKHLEVNAKMPLKPGHFTRWLYLFEQAVKQNHQGENVDRMLRRAETVAKSIAAAISDQKRGDMDLVLPKRS